VSATLGAAAVTIVTDGSHAALHATPSPVPSPSRVESLMPVSVERPTGVRPASARPVATQPASARPVASTAGVALPVHTAASKRAAARVDMSIGRRAEPTIVRQATAVKHRQVAASIGDLHLSEKAVQRLGPGRPARTR
jgi:hypothetical protein